jgi:hypothetical protein
MRKSIPPFFLSAILTAGNEEVALTAKASISLTDDQDAFARSLVESGQSPSLSAVG